MVFEHKNCQLNIRIVCDAIIVSIEVIRKHCRHLKYDKHIQVITTLDNEIDWLDIEAIQSMLKQENISITAMYVCFEGR